MSDEEIDISDIFWEERMQPKIGIAYTGVKRPFFHQAGGTSFDEVRFYNEIKSRTGICIERLKELNEGQCKLTDDEFASFKRCPAHMIPDSELKTSKDGFLKILSELNKCTNPVKVSGFSKDGIAGDSFHLDVEFTKTANLITPYIKIRPRRLLQAINHEGLLNGKLLAFVKKLMRSNFTGNRFCATIMAYMTLPKSAVIELEWLLSSGGYNMSTRDWLKLTKAHHNYVKSTRKTITGHQRLEPCELADFLYMNHTVGRDHFMNNEDSEVEVAARANIPDDYIWPGGNEVRFSKFCSNRWGELMSESSLIRKARTWEDFKSNLYTILPGGSSRIEKMDMNAIGKIVGRDKLITYKDVRGNKRYKIEIESVRHFSEFEAWCVTAFLKYEVAKNRWLYPANTDWVILGLFIMDSLVDSFNGTSGVDMGHTLEGSIGVKLTVLAMVRSLAVCLNTDGKGFNENHSFKDMCILYDTLLLTASNHPDQDSDALKDLADAVEKYKEGLGKRKIKLPKLWKGAVEHALEVYHTLFSGEGPTQMLNTFMIGSAVLSGAELMSEDHTLQWVKSFFKGDDLNGFMENWLQVWLLLKTMEDSGYIFEPSKDHIEQKQCEHERCIVSETKYHGTIMRRIGAMVASEPQGSSGLTFIEAMASANEARMSLICRGASGVNSNIFFRATVMTFLNESSVSPKLWKSFSTPKFSGGFGLWKRPEDSVLKRSPLPNVAMNFKLAEGSVFEEFGTAHLTDNILREIVRDTNMSVDILLPAREAMIGDSFIACLGVAAKYGNTRRSNIALILDTISLQKTKFIKLMPNGPLRLLADRTGIAVSNWTNSPEEFGTRICMLPEDVVQRAISKSGCVSEKLCRLMMNLKSKTAFLKWAVSGGKDLEVENQLVISLNSLPIEEQHIFYEGELPVIFQHIHEKVNAEVAALIRRIAIHHVALNVRDLGFGDSHQLNAHVKWDMVCITVARAIFNANKKVWESVAF